MVRSAPTAGAAVVECDMLLTLPGVLESEFWGDARTLKAYTLMDFFAAVYTALTASLAAKILWPALSSPRILRLGGQALIAYIVIIVGGALVCVATATVLVRCPGFYARHRHNVVVFHKCLWMGFCICITMLKHPEVQLAFKEALASKVVQKQAIEQDSSVGWQVAVRAALGPYILLPINALSTSNWVMKMRWFLPLQVIHTLINAHGAWADMPCNAAADARLSQLLQPACEGMMQLQRLILGLLIGPGFSKHSPASFGACTGTTNSSQLLAWYQQVAYGLFVLCTAFGYLEWRLKASFVQQRLRKRLAYGPWRWVMSAHAVEDTGSGASVLHGVLSYSIAMPACLSALWFVSLWLVPRLPQNICPETCDATGTCTIFKPCEGFWCRHPGLAVAVVVYLLLLGLAHAHSVTFFFM